MDTQQLHALIAKEAGVKPNQAKQVIELLEDGNTVPFIARYRKEATGSLDEVQIKAVEDRYTYIQNLEQRKIDVIRSIEEQQQLTPELEKAIKGATVLQRVEDLYRPYKQKRRTKAIIAKEKGLQGLADWLLKPGKEQLKTATEQYISTEKGVETAEEAIAGAQDILAELFADDPDIREKARRMTRDTGLLETTAKKGHEDEKQVFQMYYEYSEAIKKIVPHRILAINRGEKEGVLKVTVTPPVDRIIRLMKDKWMKTASPAAKEVEEAIEDSYKRLIQPSIEREIRTELSEKGETQAIHIFSENLRNLLLQPPMKDKMVLGIDPAYRTGCKLAVIDATGKLLEVAVIYPHPPKSDQKGAKKILQRLTDTYPIEIMAIGNGTASRETEQFVADFLGENPKKASYVIVNEAGASVYSASDVARAEFPDLQVEERSAASIARRLQDPLSELVKIDPKAVGVGQYQHDVSQKKLADQLTFVVETAVNQVGVNVNSASASLLQYVAGLSKTVAENIIKVRDENGRFTSRVQLKKIPRLGAKTYEQAVGFLRITEGKNPLDATGIHPESYEAAERILKLIDADKKMIGRPEIIAKLEDLDLESLSREWEVGKVTLKDIVDALKKPFRDPRDEFPQPLLKSDVLKMEDLTPGMEVQGTVRNVVDFGAFVDIGVKQDGLVHISKLKKGFVKHPLDVVAVGDIVTVWVDQVEKQKGRIALTMLPPKEQQPDLQER
ncbi:MULTISPECIES: Tex family protein [unclassified Planococcus (in: firmicutes)]|uniref:Tex family protein n=1 Tax=unclassified Planococcus (in: firmicutes) TaxID=2662419 RepID=UPI000C7A8DD2|nr:MULTISPECIES: Tex family protein [unclassified Planococcus (in: firmicutes)]PKG47614.1 RNA-binding transcriptional accessory protein [Planococcus sp. Urea-trap-24]PKG88064.1 RNA-binding transcriptional accessory protein [Planococcus sp. Urea-3u-39]PKH37014.1 RNA-binding transcriptional accessory protein [Planococcus sp. MB-3u-09]